jgi:hypothetical protein
MLLLPVMGWLIQDVSLTWFRGWGKWFTFDDRTLVAGFASARPSDPIQA